VERSNPREALGNPGRSQQKAFHDPHHHIGNGMVQ
jgi:hypothetical protein